MFNARIRVVRRHLRRVNKRLILVPTPLIGWHYCVYSDLFSYIPSNMNALSRTPPPPPPRTPRPYPFVLDITGKKLSKGGGSCHVMSCCKTLQGRINQEYAGPEARSGTNRLVLRTLKIDWFRLYLFRSFFHLSG